MYNYIHDKMYTYNCIVCYIILYPKIIFDLVLSHTYICVKLQFIQFQREISTCEEINNIEVHPVQSTMMGRRVLGKFSTDNGHVPMEEVGPVWCKGKIINSIKTKKAH